MSPSLTTLPASWYTSKAFYNLERRAVFLKSWMVLGSVTRWPNVGEDYHNEMAQVKFVVRRESQTWTSIKIFSVEDGSEIRSHLTRTGLLFVTLSHDSVAFEEFFPGLEDMLSHVDFTQLQPRKCLRYEGKYNWKTMVDGYQECLHCPYAHPAFSKVYKPQIYYEVHNKHNYSQHVAQTNNPEDGLFIYLFPNTCLNIYGGGMSTFRVCPSDDPIKTTMEFDYYYKQSVDSEEFKSYYSFVRTVGIEDHELCEKAQENLNVGIYTEGLLNPLKENGVSYYQGLVLDMVVAQFHRDGGPILLT